MQLGFFDWKFVATVLVTVAAPLWLWQYDVSSRSITVTLISSVQKL